MYDNKFIVPVNAVAAEVAVRALFGDEGCEMVDRLYLAINDAMDKAWEDGYDKGTTDGYDDGFNDGHLAGYEYGRCVGAQEAMDSFYKPRQLDLYESDWDDCGYEPYFPAEAFQHAEKVKVFTLQPYQGDSGDETSKVGC